MSFEEIAPKVLRGARAALATVAMANMSVMGVFVPSAQAEDGHSTRTPIKHVIIIVGENRSVDHVFATYQPKAGESVDNLLSRHIIKADGTPDVNYGAALQNTATDTSFYNVSPGGKEPYKTLPAPLTGGPSDVCANNGLFSLADAQASAN